MNHLYHKVAVASICSTLGFTLGASEEAKAATFSLAPIITFVVSDVDIDVDNPYYPLVGRPTHFDGLGDYLSPNNFDVAYTQPKYIEGGNETASFAEFNINNFPVVPNTFIKNAIFQAEIYSFGVNEGLNPGSLGIFGYVGNGTAEISDFEAGVFLSSVDVSFSSSGDFLNFDVTPFVNQRVSNGSAFAGFGIRALNPGGLILGGQYFPGIQPRLIIETEPVPEPTTIFGSALALCLGGWVKRKKSTLQNKAKSQHFATPS
jgi:hypothetical protein